MKPAGSVIPNHWRTISFSSGLRLSEERRRRLMAGQHQKEDFSTLAIVGIERAGIIACVCELDGKVCYVNENILRLQRHDGLLDLQSLKRLSDVSDGFDTILKAVENEKMIVNREFLFRTHSSGVKRFICNAGVAEHRGGSYCVIIMHDCAPYNQAFGENRLHAILDGLEEGYYETDLRGNLMYVNRAFNTITEYEYGEAIGKNYRVFFGSDDVEKIYRSFHEVFVTGNPSKLTYWVALSKTGRRKKIEASISLMSDHEGNSIGFRGIIRDVTEKDMFEKELIRARKIEAIGILAGGIAHDYNNALTAILGNISLAKKDADSGESGLLDALNDAEAASLKAVELTKRLSIFAQGGKPERKTVEYAESLKSVVGSVLSGYSGRYEIQVLPGLWKVYIDEFQINQVITYMLNNAVESMPVPGPIIVSAENIVVEQEESRQELTLQPGKYVRISIRDRGAGIGADDMHRIFDPYFTTKEMASGMGLATSYAIIKRHHGYIDVDTAPGKGSTFYIYLPVADPR
jgi:PAS domain S-box-containing protein